MLTQFEKALLYDELEKEAKWKPVSNSTGYWEIHVWASQGDEFQAAVTKTHNKKWEDDEEEKA